MKRKIILTLEITLFVMMIFFRYFRLSAMDWIKANPILNAFLYFFFFFIVINLLSKSIKYYYRKKLKLKSGEKNNIYFGIENVASFILFLGFIFSISVFFNIDIKVLLTSLSIVAAAIAIVSREFIVDFLSGINLSFSKVFDINDYVFIAPHKGNITAISLFKTTILNENGDVVHIPNGKVNSNEIINYTKRDIGLISIDFQVDIQLMISIDQFENELISSLSEFKEYIEDQSFNLKIVDLKKDYIDLKFQYKINKMDIEILKQIRKQMARQVLNYVTERKML